MSFQENIDFTKYGLNWTIPNNMEKMPQNFKDNVSSVKREDNKLAFNKPNGEVVNIVLNEFKGAGTYGKTYSSLTQIDKGVDIVVKIIDFTGSTNASNLEYDTIQEALIQILIYEASKDFKDTSINLIGPFCPKFYLLGRENQTMFIVMEQVSINLNNILRNNFDKAKQKAAYEAWRPPASKFVRQVVLQITVILKELYKRIGYNHRDFKPDNIMFNTVNGKPNIKLIDFGFSCLKYKNLGLKSKSRDVYSSRLISCDSETRDLHAFFYFFCYYTYYKTVDCPLKRVIRALMSSDENEPRNWGATYLNYDSKNRDSSPIRPLNLSLDIVHNVFKDIEFSKVNNTCTPINYKWVKHLVKLYRNTPSYITKEEYSNGINDQVKEAFIKGYIGKDFSFWANSKSQRQLVDEVIYSVILSDEVYEDNTTLGLESLQDYFIANSSNVPADKLGENLLHKAVRAGSELLLDKILDKTGSVWLNNKNTADLSPLDIAINVDNVSVQNKLIYKGANTNFYDCIKIMSIKETFNTIANKNPQIFTRIPNDNVVNYAIRNNDTVKCLKLVELNIPVNFDHFYYDLSAITDSGVLKILWDKYKNDSGINRKYYGRSPLSNAAYLANLELVKLFLSHPTILTTAKDNEGLTCLHYAVLTYVSSSGKKKEDALEIIKLLIEANPALPDMKDNKKRGPGNPYYAKDSEARTYIKERKSTLFTKRKNTNVGKSGGLRKTRYKTQNAKHKK